MSEKWNLLFLLCDEFRFPPQYNQTPEIKDWERKNLRAMEELRKTGVEFRQHYASSMACAPSRTTLFTGQYYTLHGVSQTDGAAKKASDPDMFWLDPNTVPTSGNYLEECGYQTYYKGKWHINNSDIVLPGTQDYLLSYNALGYPEVRTTNLYLQANRLEKYGFNKYVGPVSHGSNPRDSGASSNIGLSGRDVVYTADTVELIKQLEEQKRSRQPWCIVSSLLSPHDIALYGEISKRLPTFNFDVDPTLPPIPPAPTSHEDLSTKPKCQKDYTTKYQEAFQPTLDTPTFRKVYYTLQKKIDDRLFHILQTLKVSSFYKNTVVVLTSDHGDLLGSHDQFQKWYQAYEESIHVPLFIRLPIHLNQRKSPIDSLTTHVDLLPTLLHLLGNSSREITEALLRLKKTHVDARHLVGRNLSQLVWAASTKSHAIIEGWPDKPILFLNGDLVLTGPQNIGWNGKRYTPIVQPSTIQTIILVYQKERWKFSRYYDPLDDTIVPEFELYNLNQDPYEEQNLLSTKYVSRRSLHLGQKFARKLYILLKKKALTPREKPQKNPLIPRPS